ncbi:hypothetical protein TWF481_009035 [Arthrobotrys musiformis]|uniref:Peptidase S8/S53 domain-containing protein n=1 Tax=Arthrobotrys musiformis TaxID=47236 RepID=A0AAV9W4J9_9PEZI
MTKMLLFTILFASLLQPLFIEATAAPKATAIVESIREVMAILKPRDDENEPQSEEDEPEPRLIPPKVGTWENGWLEVLYFFPSPETLKQNGITPKIFRDRLVKFMTLVYPELLPPRKTSYTPLGSSALDEIFALRLKLSVTRETANWKVQDEIAEDFGDILLEPATLLIAAPVIPPTPPGSPTPESKSPPNSPRKQRLARNLRRRSRDFVSNGFTSTNVTDPFLIPKDDADNTTRGQEYNTTNDNQYRESQQGSDVHKRAGQSSESEPEVERGPKKSFDDACQLGVPPGFEWDDELKPRTWRWKDAGKGVQIYVIDTGCDTRHPEFENAKKRFKWLFPTIESLREVGDTIALDEKERPNYGHGTQVIAKIVGENIGVSRSADITIVKTEVTSPERLRGSPTTSASLNAWIMVLDAIAQRRAAGDLQYCVVQYSGGHPPPSHTPGASDYIMKRIIKAIGSLNCYVVVAAGNVHQDQENLRRPNPPTSYPHVLAGDPDLAGTLVVVGGHDPEGYNMYQYDKFTKISAQAQSVVSVKTFPFGPHPQGRWSSMLSYCSGTSFSAPVVSGLLANFISQGYKDPLGYLLAISKAPLRRGEPRRAFNGIYPDMYPDQNDIPWIYEFYKRPRLKDPRVAEKGPPRKLAD